MPAPRHLHTVQSIEPLQGGGLGAAALQLHSHLAALGHESTLLTTTAEAQPTNDPRVQQFARRGPGRLYFAPGLADVAAAWITAGSAVVHSHGFYVYPSAVVGRLARRHAAPLVLHPHGMFEPWILARSRGKKWVAHQLFENANFRSARLWRALTAHEADQIRAQGVTAPVIVVPNGIDPPRPAGPRNLAGRTRRQVLFLGRLHPKKGLALLIAAWARLGPLAADWEVVIAGPDELGHRAELETQVLTAGLESSIRFVGPVAGETKQACLRAAEVFILPSLSEGFSLAILEALAASVPVVATTACNFPELAAAGAGWVCAPTLEGVTTALSTALAEDDAARQQRGACGRALVEERYAWPALAAALHSECARLL